MMDDDIYDGGPAFPIDLKNLEEEVSHGFEGITTWPMGMSRRDYFAAAALSGGLEQGVEDEMSMGWWHSPAKIAERAYAIADAMLRQSSKPASSRHMSGK
jgi:hypothetical protein